MHAREPGAERAARAHAIKFRVHAPDVGLQSSTRTAHSLSPLTPGAFLSNMYFIVHVVHVHLHMSLCAHACLCARTNVHTIVNSMMRGQHAVGYGKSGDKMGWRGLRRDMVRDRMGCGGCGGTWLWRGTMTVIYTLLVYVCVGVSLCVWRESEGHHMPICAFPHSSAAAITLDLQKPRLR